MILKMFAIRDTKGAIYFPPFYKNTPAEAQRDFQTVANDAKTQIGQYPEDFDLFQIGTFDQLSGKIQTLDTPVHMVKAIDLTKKN